MAEIFHSEWKSFKNNHCILDNFCLFLLSFKTGTLPGKAGTMWISLLNIKKRPVWSCQAWLCPVQWNVFLMRGDIMSSRKGLHFFILCKRPLSIQLPSDSLKRPSPAPRLQRQQQKSPCTAHKHLLALDATRKWKPTLWFRRGEWVLEAWLWRNRRWHILSYRSFCLVLSSQ